MKTLHLLLIIIGSIYLSSCKPEVKEKKEAKVKSENEAEFNGKEEIETKIAEIDNNDQLTPANSLTYTHSDGSTEEATAYLNDKDEILKIEERFSESGTGVYGRRIFYFENGKRISTKEIYLDNSSEKPVFIELQSFYDKNEKVRYSQQREADFEEYLEMSTFKMAKTKDCPSEKVMQILNQKGHFATTFQGFASNGEMDFLIVGEDQKEGYTSSLAIQHKEGDIAKLLANQRAYIGKPLRVQFERMIDGRDFEFQVLVALSIN